MPQNAQLPKGLRLFPPGTPASLRRAKLLFVGVVLTAAMALVWPVFSWVAGPRPFVLGLPLPFAWVILWLSIVFAALVWLYRTECGEPAGNSDPSAGQ